MFFSKYILPLPFFIALFIGFLMVYITAPQPEIICKHPTPDNVDKIQYKDLLNNCFTFKYKKLNCHEVDQNILKNIPIQF